ncbi:MAG: CotH kinase family protein [Bacteroidota bacterium]
MKRRFIILLLGLLFHYQGRSQNTLFDDTRLSSIYVTISPDSLQVIYDSVLSDHYYMARFIFDDNVKRDTLENIGFRLRGNTSRYSQKKSFKISFSEYVSGRKYQGVKKINLNGEHNDPTMIREKLFYDLWKKAGNVERRTCFVKVYINGAYYGLYTNLEEMEKEWLTLVYQTNNGGNLYKCAYPADLVYHGSDQQTYKNLQNSTATGGRVYELQTNKSLDDYTHLVQLITVLNQQPDTLFVTAIKQVLNVDGFLKSLALDVATGNWDDYGYNKNNYYLYDNPANGKFDFITYDPDNTFGVDWFGIDWAKRDCRNWINRSMQLPLSQKILAVPSFFEKYKLYLDTIARTVIHPDTVFYRIDAMKQLIQQAAVQDNYRTLDYGYTLSDFNNSFTQSIDEHTPYGLKPFFSMRMQSILDQLHPSGIDDRPSVSSGLKVFPNPATDNIRVIADDNLSSLAQVKIIDTYGKTVKELSSENLSGAPFSIPIDDLDPGLYLLNYFSGGKHYQASFIKK